MKLNEGEQTRNATIAVASWKSEIWVADYWPFFCVSDINNNFIAPWIKSNLHYKKL